MSDGGSTKRFGRGPTREQMPLNPRPVLQVSSMWHPDVVEGHFVTNGFEHRWHWRLVDLDGTVVDSCPKTGGFDSHRELTRWAKKQHGKIGEDFDLIGIGADEPPDS